MNMTEYDNNIKNEIEKLINNFKRHNDVMSGSAFRIGSMQPNSWGEAITTSGYCVKVSEVFLNRMLKNSIYSHAKLISIELDSNRFGRNGDNTHNAWHTAIEYFDYVIDLTCGQFGSQYIDRWLWDKDGWLTEFETQDKLMFKPINEYLNESLLGNAK